jgi:acyl carrier protein
MSPALREHLASLIESATDGTVPAADLLAADALAPGVSLTELGLDSLGFLRLIDALEAEFGIEVALHGEPPPDSLDALADYLLSRGLNERRSEGR